MDEESRSATPAYDSLGRGYALRRRPDPRLARALHAALGEARSVLNVGAGTGSYEPDDRDVVAVEPSAEMIAQRPQGAARVVQANAEDLPFETSSFDAALAVLTVHHWSERTTGLAELRRVARKVVVILTWDPAHPGFWLTDDYFPDALAADRRSFPPLGVLDAALGPSETRAVAIPHDCTDGFFGAYWRRPGAYLETDVRASISTFDRLRDVAARIDRLQKDLASGAWAARHSRLLALEELDLGYRIVIAWPSPGT